METTPVVKRPRGRPKATPGPTEKASAEEAENAPSVNGDKDGDGDGGDVKATVEGDAEAEKEVRNEEGKDREGGSGEKKSGRGRKRKASEVKGEEAVEEEHVEEVKSSEPEKMDTDEGEGEKEKDDDSNEKSLTDTELNLPPKQTLGKGKRARIPNKRYSDIAITSTPPRLPAEMSPKKPAIENGDSNIEIEVESAENTSAHSSPTHKTKGSPTTPAAKKPKISTVDLTNPNYLKPFEYGWKRELVYRATADPNIKRNGDIYYYTPNGKKVRSMREVSENLKNKELTLDDFTFFKEPLGVEDPEKEIIREAKVKTAVLGVMPKRSTTPKTPKMPKPTSPKQAPAAGNSDAETPKVKASPRVGGFKVKLPTKGEKGQKAKAAKKTKEDEDMEIGMYPPNWASPTSKKAPGKWNNSEEMDKPCRPCSIRCQGVSGLIPTLQCRLCLCLYHNECVGLLPQAIVQGYVCKNCQLDLDQNSGSSATITSPNPVNPVTSPELPSNLPKLQRMTKPGEQTVLNPPKDPAKTTMPKLTPKPGSVPPAKSAETPAAPDTKNLVGAVTTWFPPSSTIQMGELRTGEPGSAQTLRPQYVEYVGNKKYLIVPTHNVVAVSPTINWPSQRKTGEKGVTEADGFSYSVLEAPRIDAPAVVGSASLGPESSVKIEPGSVSEPSPMETDSSLTSDSFAQSCLVPDIPPGAGQADLEFFATTDQETESPSKKKTTKVATQSKADSKHPEESRFMDNYLQNLSYGYQALLYVFQYLKVQDLLRAGCVCTMWRDLASHPSLWRTVRMKNSQVHKFDGLAQTLNKHGTIHLDLRKMLLPGNNAASAGGDDIWPLFSSAIQKVESLRKIELCRCPAAVVEQLAETNPKLEVLNAVTIKCETMSLTPLEKLKDLQELRLKSTTGLTLTSDLSALKGLVSLKHLSLTSIKDLNKLDIGVIAELTNLESLELGECTDFAKSFGVDILTKLTNLEKLRLEKGQGNCYTFEILEAVRNMPKLEQLELVNFDIKSGFDKALGACTNIKKLLIIPTYISQSATTNHMVLGGVLRLQHTLSHFVWGVTLELLRVTELFVDQCEDPEKKDKKDKKPSGNGDSIPVLKPVPLLLENMDSTNVLHDPPQVEILPLPNLQKLLLANLPTTRVKILKIPFHATWRQSITDNVN